MTVNPAYKLVKAWEKDSKSILERANMLAKRRLGNSARPLTPSQIIDHLIAPEKKSRKGPLRVYRTKADTPAITVERVTSTGDIVIRLHAKATPDLGELKHYLATVLKDFG